MSAKAAAEGPYAPLARLEAPPRPQPGSMPPAPSDEACFALWDRFEMLPHIRRHSLVVAQVATRLALYARQAGHAQDVQQVRASALLHDIAKTYTIRYGGSHSQLGGAWMQEITGNALLAMGIVHHVHWPWALDVTNSFLPLAIIYSDKRVMHDKVVPLDVRFKDLYARYGTTEYIRARLAESMAQSVALEKALGHLVGANLHEDTFDSGRLVQ